MKVTKYRGRGPQDKAWVDLSERDLRTLERAWNICSEAERLYLGIDEPRPAGVFSSAKTWLREALDRSQP